MKYLTCTVLYTMFFETIMMTLKVFRKSKTDFTYTLPKSFLIIKEMVTLHPKLIPKVRLECIGTQCCTSGSHT